MRDFTLAAISIKVDIGETEKNISTHKKWIKKAKKAGAELVCFPEMSVNGFMLNNSVVNFQKSEPIDGPSTQKLIKVAQKNNITVGFGLATKDIRDVVYNSYIFVSPDGYLGHYNKTHIPPAEYTVESPANDFSVIDVGFARIGVNLCFDNWFFESARCAYLNGAEIILAPFVMGSDFNYEGWKELAMKNFPCASYQNGVYHVTINTCGNVEKSRVTGKAYTGPSLILVIDPSGDLVCQSNPEKADTEQMVVHKINRELIDKRRSNSLFHPKYRRPEIYRSIATAPKMVG